jgi:hypothetical protein
MITVLPRRLLHRKIAGQPLTISGKNWITIGPRGPITVDVFGEKLARYFYPHAIGQSGQRHI